MGMTPYEQVRLMQVVHRYLAIEQERMMNTWLADNPFGTWTQSGHLTAEDRTVITPNADMNLGYCWFNLSNRPMVIELPYYRLLGQVRTDGDWEAWVDFFLEGVEQTASGAVGTANRLLELMRSDRVRVAGLRRSAVAASRVFSVLCERPIASVGDAASRLGVSLPTATRGIEALAGLGIVGEITGRQRSRLYGRDFERSELSPLRAPGLRGRRRPNRA